MNALCRVGFALVLLSFFSCIAFSQSPQQAATDLKALAGISVQEKDGQITSVDFKNCQAGWIDRLPLLIQMSSVQTVAMSGPLVTNEAVLSFAKMDGLKSLRLEQAAIDDSFAARVHEFAKLEELTLDRCSLVSDNSLANLAHSKTLKRLRVPGTAITDAGLLHLKSMLQLELLDIGDCKISDEGLEHLSGLTKMRNLVISGPKITDAGLAHLKGMTNMAAIAIRNCAATDAGFASLSGMTKLKEFDIFQTKAGDGALSIVANAKELSKLKLRASGITSKGIAAHISKFENLTSLDLGETATDNVALESIGKLKKLDDLNLLRTQIDDEGVAFLSGLKLKRLNLDDIAGITDNVTQHLLKLPTLEFLHLGKTKITDKTLVELASLTNLKDLLVNNTIVSEKAVQDLGKQLPKLKIKR